MALVMSVVLARGGAGQETPVVIGSGVFQGGILKMDLGELNASLGVAGHPTFGNEALPTWGGGGYGAIGKLLVGGEGY